MKGMIKDKNSGAWLSKPTAEQLQLQSLKQKIDAIYNTLSDTNKKKVDKEVSSS